MVARITTGKSIKGAINYNEHKVRFGQAELIAANGYTKDSDALNLRDKTMRLEKLAALNGRATTNCLHISLNFDPSEKLDRQQLNEIAAVYMNKIGFGGQPYLIYQHHDAAHPHIHIVTTNIQKDGKRISMHSLGRLQSEKARKEIEARFSLIKANDRQNKLVDGIKPANLERAVYGKTETKRAIANIVGIVVNQYKYTSLAELNTVLNLYNVTADRGEKGTRIFEKNGLQYSLINEDKIKTGIPLKASALYGKPILKLLEKKFIENEENRKPFKQNLMRSIDEAFTLQPMQNRQSFLSALKQKGIDTVFRINDTGLVYGVTFIDHRSKSVFKGSDLGKGYSAASLQARMKLPEQETEEKTRSKEVRGGGSSFHPKQKAVFDIKKPIPLLTTASSIDLLRIVVDASQPLSYVPFQFRRKKKKKRNIRI